MKKSFSLLIVCGSAILSSSSVIFLVYKTGFLFSMMIIFFLLTFIILLIKYNSHKRIQQMASIKKDFEITNPNDQKTIFITNSENMDSHDFQIRIATQDRA
jgi:hypothetical protein